MVCTFAKFVLWSIYAHTTENNQQTFDTRMSLISSRKCFIFSSILTYSGGTDPFSRRLWNLILSRPFKESLGLLKHSSLKCAEHNAMFFRSCGAWKSGRCFCANFVRFALVSGSHGIDVSLLHEYSLCFYNLFGFCSQIHSICLCISCLLKPSSRVVR